MPSSKGSVRTVMGADKNTNKAVTTNAKISSHHSQDEPEALLTTLRQVADLLSFLLLDLTTHSPTRRQHEFLKLAVHMRRGILWPT